MDSKTSAPEEGARSGILTSDGTKTDWRKKQLRRLAYDFSLEVSSTEKLAPNILTYFDSHNALQLRRKRLVVLKFFVFVGTAKIF